MIKLSRLTDYAVVVLAEMARPGRGLMSAAALAEQTGLGEATVAKIMKTLTRYHIVTSTRGTAGGYRLARQPQELTIGTIIEAMEGPVALTACLDVHADCCTLEKACYMKGRWSSVNNAIRQALEKMTLADMIEDNDDNPVQMRQETYL